jgi:hypothetical protein
MRRDNNPISPAIRTRSDPFLIDPRGSVVANPRIGMETSKMTCKEERATSASGSISRRWRDEAQSPPMLAADGNLIHEARQSSTKLSNAYPSAKNHSIQALE